MSKQFATERFELLHTDRIHIDDYVYGRDRRGALDVWIERGRTGETFLRQLTVKGVPNAVTRGVDTQKCHFLKERASGRYFFLDGDARGFYLQSDTFFGAEAFLGADAVKITQWLAAGARDGGVL